MSAISWSTKFHNILGAVRGIEPNTVLGNGLQRLESIIQGRSEGNYIEEMTKVGNMYMEALVKHATHNEQAGSLGEVNATDSNGSDDTEVTTTLLESIHAHVLECSDDYMLYYDRPEYVTPIADWITRVAMEGLAMRAGIKLDLTLPSRSNSKRLLTDLVKVYREVHQQEKEKEGHKPKDWYSLEASRELNSSPKVEGNGETLPKSLNERTIWKSTTVDREDQSLREDKVAITQIDGSQGRNKIKILKDCEFITRDLKKFKGEVIYYAEFKCEILHILQIYNTNDPEVVIAGMDEQLRMNVRHQMKYGDTALDLIKRLDMEYLDEAIKMFDIEFDQMEHKPMESIQTFINRFEKVIRIKETLDGPIEPHMLLRKFKSSFKRKEVMTAVYICDPEGEFEYHRLKRALVRTLTLMDTFIPPKKESHHIRSIEAEEAFIKSARVELKLAENACYRCGESGHRAHRCYADTIYRKDERCQKCGNICVGQCQKCCDAKLTCHRCKGTGHLAGVCRKTLNAPKPKIQEENRKIEHNPTPVFGQNLDSRLPTFGRSLDSRLPITEANRLIRHSIKAVGTSRRSKYLNLRIGEKDIGKHCATRALIDSGCTYASADRDVVSYLIEKGVIARDRLRTTPTVQVTFANGESLDAAEIVTIPCKIKDEETDLEMLVIPSLSDDFIIGLNLFDQLGLRIVSDLDIFDDQEPVGAHFQKDYIRCINVAGITRLEATIPLLEKCNVYPFREPPRKRSLNDQEIIHQKLVALSASGAVQRTTVNNIAVINEVVLVDKQKSAEGKRPPPTFPTDLSRYRITLDCTTLNSWIISEVGDNVLFGPTHMDDSGKSYHFKQGSPSIETIIRSIPNLWCNCYAKIDLSEAYHSVLLHPRIWKLFGTVSINEKGLECHWTYSSLSQGWTWSPYLFRLSIQFVIDKINQKAEKFLVKNVFDDVLICSGNADDCELGLEVTKQILLEYGFTINDKKCQQPSTSVTFCGYVLNGKHLLAKQSKVSFESWKTDFIHKKNRPQLLKSLRCWCGVMNYSQKYRCAEDQVIIAKLFKYIPILETTVAIDQVKEEILQLVIQLERNPLIPLNIGSPSVAIGTLIVTDANRDSYSGIIFRVVACSPDRSSLDANTLKLIQEAFDYTDEVNLELIGLEGDIFCDNVIARSSTFRERLAILKTISKNIHLLSGLVVCATDNKNSTKHWTDLECLPTTDLICFMSHCHKVIWLPREHLLTQIVDNCARTLVPPVQINAMHTEDVAQDQRECDVDILTTGTTQTQNQSLAIEALPDAQADFLDLLMMEQANDPSLRNSSAEYADGFYYHQHKLIIPSSLIRLLVKRVHDVFHSGRRETVLLFNKQYYSKQVHAVAAEVCSSCPCAVAKATKRKLTHFDAIRKDTSPFEDVAIDTVGPIKPADDDYQYILSIQCRSTGYIVLRPVKNVGVDSMISNLKQVFYEHAFPGTMLTDNFPSFTSKKFTEFAEKYDIKLLNTPIHSPHRNGLLERQHRVIGDILRYYFSINDKNWTSKLAMIQARINHRTLMVDQNNTAINPFNIIHNYNFRCPGIAGDTDRCNHRYDDIMDMISQIRLSKETGTEKRSYVFAEGQQVLRYSPVVDQDNSGKLNMRFKRGVITKILGKRTYQIRDTESSKTFICDAQNLRRGGM